MDSNTISLERIFVDFDGTLTKSDSLWEMTILLIKHRPHFLFSMFLWLFKGKAYFKNRIWEATHGLDIHLLWNEELLQFLRERKKGNASIVLATGAPLGFALQMADELKIFDAVLGTDSTRNLTGQNKLRAIEEHCRNQPFSYVGNSSVDIPILKRAAKAYFANPSSSLLQSGLHPHKVFGKTKNQFKMLLKAMRPHQWVKNLLVFVPLIAGHFVFDTEKLKLSAIAFVCMCFAASGVYLLNDLLDLPSDRRHASKHKRPLSSGDLSIPVAIVAMIAFTLLSLGIAFSFSPAFAAVLGIYLVVTTLYSFRWKKIMLLDVFSLASLYTLRVIAGHVITGIVFSPWLLSFSIYLFLSLALAKRQVELVKLKTDSVAHGRGYSTDDLGIVSGLGLASGAIAVLVLAIYITNPESLKLYNNPWILMTIGPLLLYWLARIWILASRGELNDDPIAFAVKDKQSYLILAIMILTLVLATIPLP